MPLAAPALSEATDRNRPSLEVITLACTPLLRAASLIALRTSTSLAPSAMSMSRVSPPTVSVSLPAPKVCSAVTGWLAVHLLALARSSTWMVYSPLGVPLPTVAASTVSVPTLPVRLSKASAALSAFSAVSRVLKAELTVPSAETLNLALDSMRLRRASAGLRSAATSFSTMPVMSRPEPTPP